MIEHCDRMKTTERRFLLYLVTSFSLDFISNCSLADSLVLLQLKWVICFNLWSSGSTFMVQNVAITSPIPVSILIICYYNSCGFFYLFILFFYFYFYVGRNCKKIFVSFVGEKL